jgi:ATP phosphoribosyltransferase
MLTIALPKGRLQKPVLERFARAGIAPEEDPGSSRKLIVPAAGGVAARFLVLKDGDVPLYVERGAADVGVCGLDQLLESGADVLTPIDLGFGRCRLCVAAPRGSRLAPEAGKATEYTDAAELGRSLRIASKYPRLAARAFARRGIPIDLVRLSGSVELAAVAGLADAIVDLVESGRTLAENGLVVVQELLAVSARLVVNRASYRLKVEELLPLLEKVAPGGTP